jgi:hypothetical protein
MHHGVCQLSGLLSLLRRPLGKSPRVRVREPSRLKTPPLLNVSAPPRASPQTLPGALASFSLLRRLPIEPC